MKKVMIYAYTKFNLGDDLFIKILCDRYPNTKFVLYAPREYKLCFREINNISFVPSDLIIIRGLNYFLKHLKINNFFRSFVAKSCDGAVYIGGSLFIQSEKWEEGLESIKTMRIKQKPFFLLGANFGPFSNEDFYIRYKKIFEKYTDICFREKYSYDLFRDLSNVRMADDIVFQLANKDSIEQENNIVISVIKPSFRKHLNNNYDEIYYTKIKDIALFFIERGYNVTLMSFCEFEGDEEAIEKIINLIPGILLNKVTKHLYKLNIEETLNVIARSKLVVATRFHSMILGWVYNKPVFPIVYSDKMTNVMKDVSFKGFYTDFNNINNLEPEQVFECMSTNFIDVSKQVKNAEKHFEKLDMFLLENKM